PTPGPAARTSPSAGAGSYAPAGCDGPALQQAESSRLREGESRRQTPMCANNSNDAHAETAGRQRRNKLPAPSTAAAARTTALGSSGNERPTSADHPMVSPSEASVGHPSRTPGQSGSVR